MQLPGFAGGQKAIQTLASLIGGGRLPHAILLEGPSGCGKRTLARHLAAAILCGEGDRPCGHCESCEKVYAGHHPDVITIAREEGESSFRIEKIRAMRSDAFIMPNEASAKVYLLFSVEEMTTAAGNAILKILEEPPENVYFILTCENKAALLGTIVSRVVTITVETPSVPECLQVLERECPEVGAEKRRQVAVLFDGNVGQAKKALGDEAFQKVFETACQLLEALLASSEYPFLCALSAFEREKETLARVLGQMKRLIRQVLRHKLNAQEGDPQLEQLVAKLSHSLTPGQLLQVEEALASAGEELEQNVNTALLITALSGQLRQAVGR